MADESENKTDRILVWDLPTRLFHWLLATALAGSWITHEAGLEWTQMHMWLGYTVLSLVVFRIIWGFFGPKNARFSSFLAGLSQTRQYASAWLAGDPPRYTGHNPLGGWAILAMLASVLVQGVTGLFNTDDIMHSGPWFTGVSKETAELMHEIHEINFNILLLLIVLHLAAIFSYWARWRVNLVTPMVDGHKPAHLADPAHAVTGQRLLLATIALAAAAGIIWLMITSAPAPSSEFYF